MTTWIASPDLMNLNYLRRMHSSASCLTVRVRTRSMYTQLKCGLPSNVSQWQTTTRLPPDYLKCDVLLFSDFEKFRASCIAHFSLDAVHYYTTPGLAWDTALRMTLVSLELITDIAMYYFVENSIRGAISMITTRCDQANFPTLPGYDASHPLVHLIYLEANNLYGWVMSQPLPTGGFRIL